MKYLFRYEKGSDLSLNNLRNGEFFFASSSELNDPAEGKPHHLFKGNTDLWQKFFDYLVTEALIELRLNNILFRNMYDGIFKKLDFNKLIPRLQYKNKPLTLSELESAVKEIFEELLTPYIQDLNYSNFLSILPKIFNEKVRLILDSDKKYLVSFSKTCISPTMWGQYANAYKGYCLIFKTKNSKIKIKSLSEQFLTSNKDEVDPRKEMITLDISDEEKIKGEDVIYRKRPPKFNAFRAMIPYFHYTEMEDHYDVPLNIIGESPLYEEQKIGIIKYSNWSYEKEIRFFYPLSIDSRKHIFTEIAKERRFLKYHPENFHGVVLGPDISRDLTMRIIESIRAMLLSSTNLFNFPLDRENRIKVYQAYSTSDDYIIKLKPYGLIYRADKKIYFQKEQNFSVNDRKMMEDEIAEHLSKI